MELNEVLHLETENLEFGYNENMQVLKGISCKISKGERVAILGQNGAGKTTFFNIICGVLKNYHGSVKVSGTEVSGLNRASMAKRVALVPQKHEPMFPFLTRDFILMGRYSRLGLMGNPSDEDRSIVESAAAETGASRFLDRPYNTLSGGEMQLALIARALTQQSDMLVLDEPNTHLDFRNQLLVMDLVGKISVSRKVTLIMSLHDPNDVLQFANRVIVIDKGKIAADGSPREVITERFLAETFGIRARAVMNSDGDLAFRTLEIMNRS